MWTGGLITLAVLVGALRSAGADRPLLQTTARWFGRLSWSALAVAVATGMLQVLDLGWPWGRLGLKITLVATAGVLALVHQLSARHTTARVRGFLQGLILVASIGIFGAAVAL